MTKDQIYRVLEDFINDKGRIDADLGEVVDAMYEAIGESPNKGLTEVQEFHEVFVHPIAIRPTKISNDRFAFRMRVILEELNEFAASLGPEYVYLLEKELVKATEENDQYYNRLKPLNSAAEALDGLVDLQYFFNGLILEMGFQFVFDQAFTMVHRANMTKAVASLEAAEATRQKYAAENVDIEIRFSTNVAGRPEYGVVYRSEDNKVLKGIDWKPADLSLLVETLQPSTDEVKQ